MDQEVVVIRKHEMAVKTIASQATCPFLKGINKK